jgi:glycosyltransferase involved in cell wall biosynthesis
MPAERLVTIHKGHDLGWYRSTPADLAAIGVPPGSFAIACVANYRPRKGIEVLVEAFSRLPETTNAHLLLIGAGMDATRLKRSIAASRATPRIHVLGYRNDAPALTAACDLFVLPSTKREGLARSLIEAMAYGVAPIVTDCGGSPELVQHGINGLVVPVADAGALAAAILTLHGDTALRARFGAAARERIGRDFRIEDTIAKTLALYRTLVGERSGVPAGR